MKNEVVILIGMPSSGKSTIGRAVAGDLKIPFVDTDNLIVDRAGKDLQHILDEDGHDAFSAIERQVLLDFNVQGPYIVATGGSAVLYDDAMEHLKEIGKLVFLDVSLPTIRKRLNNLDTRGVVLPDCGSGDVLKELFKQREPLYCKYCDVRLESDRMSIQTVIRIVSDLFVK